MRNDADPDAAWAVRFDTIIDGPRDENSDWPTLSFGDRFGPVDVAHFRHVVSVSPADVVAMATTRSPYLTGSPTQRQALVAALRQLLEEPELRGRDVIAMPLRTEVRRAYRC